MSFLSSISSMKLDANLLINLKVPDVFGKLLSAFQQIFDSVSNAVHNFTMIGSDLSIDSFDRIKENWTYVVDSTTGIRILKVERDNLTISRTRNMLRDLFE